MERLRPAPPSAPPPPTYDQCAAIYKALGHAFADVIMVGVGYIRIRDVGGKTVYERIEPERVTVRN